MKVELDNMDWKILGLLQQDARISFSELGRRVHLSQPAVAERVRRMESEGVIKGYRVEVDTDRAGYGITAFIRIASAGKCQETIDRIQKLPEVLECNSVTGEDGAILKVIAESVQSLNLLIKELTEVGETFTSIVLDNIVSFRPIQAPERLAQLRTARVKAS